MLVRPLREIVAQVTTFLDELVYYIKMTEIEQQFQMSGRIPSVDQYMTHRMGSSAVRVCLAIME